MAGDWLAWLAQFWAGLGGPAWVALRVVATVLGAWLAVRATHRGMTLALRRIAMRLEDRESLKRAGTLAQVFGYAASVVIWVLAGIMVLAELGVSVAPILGAVGVVGIAVGFGAQSLVKDYFTGFFILLENQIRQGDSVRIGEHEGLVEEITLRYVQLRDYAGYVHFIPNGMITSVINMSREYANAVIDVGVSYRENLDRVMDVMREVASQLRKDPETGPLILEDLEISGVERLDPSAVVIRARIRVAALEQNPVRREFLKRLKVAFDERGIEIPFPQMTLHQAPAAGAPPASSRKP